MIVDFFYEPRWGVFSTRWMVDYHSFKGSGWRIRVMRFFGFTLVLRTTLPID